MNKEYTVVANDYINAGKISSQIKQILKELGVVSELLRKIAVACYEAEINMVIHSNGGIITYEINDKGQLLLMFKDSGPGIENLEKALTPGFSTANDEARQFGFGAGMGLPNIKRVSDRFDINSSPRGTILKLGFDLF